MKKGRSIYTFQLNCDPNLINNLIQCYLQANEFKLRQKKGEQLYRAGNPMYEAYRYFKYSISGQILTIYAWIHNMLFEIPLEVEADVDVSAMTYKNSLNILFQEIERLNNGGVNMNNNQNNFDSNTGQPLNQNTNNNQNNFDSNTGQPLNQNMNNNQNNFDSNTGQPLNQNMNNNQNNFDSNTGQPLNQNMNNNQNNFDSNTRQPLNQDNLTQFRQTFQNDAIKKKEMMCNAALGISVVKFILCIFGIYYGVIIDFVNFYFAAQGLKTREKWKGIIAIVLSILSIIIYFYQAFN